VALNGLFCADVPLKNYSLTHPCGNKQAVLHIINECLLTKFPRGLKALHSACEDSVSWLHGLSICQKTESSSFL